MRFVGCVNKENKTTSKLPKQAKCPSNRETLASNIPVRCQVYESVLGKHKKGVDARCMTKFASARHGTARRGKKSERSVRPPLQRPWAGLIGIHSFPLFAGRRRKEEWE
jgi:hypothetical protein